MLKGVPYDLQDLVEEAARLFGVPVTLEDPSFRLIAFASQHGDLDEVRRNSILLRESPAAVRMWFGSFGIATSREPVLTPADETRGIRPRLCLPVRSGAAVRAYLWALDWPAERSADSAVVAAAVALADRIAETLRPLSATPLAVPGLVEDLLSSDPERVASGTAAWFDHHFDGAEVCVVVADGEVFVIERARAHLVAADLADRGAAEVGIGNVFAEPGELVTSFRQAKLAARLSGGPPLAFADLGALQVLTTVAPDSSVARLRLHPDLMVTALEFLDRSGSVADTAAALAIHRQTLYYRLGRIEELTGLSMRNGRQRLRLHLALLATEPP